MSEYISREAALNHIREYIDEYADVDSDGLHNLKWCAMKEAEMVLKGMPAADVCETVTLESIKSRVTERLRCAKEGSIVQACLSDFLEIIREEESRKR